VLRNAGEIVTLSGHSHEPCRKPSEESLAIIGSATKIVIASSGGKIVFLGGESSLSDYVDASSAFDVDCKGKLVMPGYVDSHTHAIFAGSREQELGMKLAGLSYLEILKRGGGILKTVRDTRSSSDEKIMEETRKRLDRMLASGTTSFEVKSGYGLSTLDEIRQLEILSALRDSFDYDITSTLLSAHAIPPDFAGKIKSYISDVVKPTIDEASRRKIASFCDVFMEQGVFGPEDSKEILQYAAMNGLETKLHADEFSDLGGAALAVELEATSADHLLKASTEGLMKLAESPVIAVLLPGTSFSSFVGNYANARLLIDSGGAVALATDLSPNSWIESMQFVVSLACYGMKMTPAEAIVGATINGAHAIRRAGEVGSIEVGKLCDLVVYDLNNYEEIPYRIGSDNVLKVVKKGSLLVDRVID
jgi:imidazolonepropionase